MTPSVLIVTRVLVSIDTLMIVVPGRDIVVCTAAILTISNSKRSDTMSNGREHDERRKAQAAAARKHRNRKRFHKGSRNSYSKEGH
jgi:hypothetical protein